MLPRLLLASRCKSTSARPTDLCPFKFQTQRFSCFFQKLLFHVAAFRQRKRNVHHRSIFLNPSGSCNSQPTRRLRRTRSSLDFLVHGFIQTTQTLLNLTWPKTKPEMYRRVTRRRVIHALIFAVRVEIQHRRRVRRRVANQIFANDCNSHTSTAMFFCTPP